MSILLRPICIAEGWFWTMRYWMQGGAPSLCISGHRSTELRSYRDERDGGPVLVEVLICERCGYLSEGWKAW